MVRWGSLRQLVGVVVVVALTAALVAFFAADRAGATAERCARHATDSASRAEAVTGSGDSVVVIGDSWSVGLGLADLRDSWPAELPGRVHVAGFSGSGFSADASPCRRVAFADRATPALLAGADLVVVEGGLNDHNQSDAAITRGFTRLLDRLGEVRVVVVGPATAPARAGAVPRVDGLLARLAAEHEVAYVATSDLDLPYLRDGLHLTAAGHEAFGRAVAARVSDALDG